MKGKRFAVLGFGILFCFALSLSGSGVHAADVVKIGATYPTSGGVAEASSYPVEGIKMAVDEINAKGGIPIEGKNLKIDLVLYDSKCDPTTGVAAAEKMISRDQVVAITGDYCSSVTLAQKEVSGRAKIIQVTPIAVHPKVTEPGYPFMFRTCNTIDMYAYPVVEFVVNQLKNVKSVALLAVTDDYGRGAPSRSTRNCLKRMGSRFRPPNTSNTGIRISTPRSPRSSRPSPMPSTL